MSDVTKIENHVEIALNTHLAVTGDNLKNLVTALAERFQGMEDAFFPLVYETDLDVATGAALDQWGELVGEPRMGLTDEEEYRGMIKARLLVNNSDGTPNRLIEILRVLAGATLVQLSEAFPKLVNFGYTRESETSDAVRQRITKAIRRALPAGTRLGWISEAPVTKPFAFAGFPGGGGFDEGTFAIVIGSGNGE